MNIIVQLQATVNQLQQMEVRYQQIEQRLQAIDRRTKISMAQNYNLRAVGRNTRIQAPNHFVPLQKTVSFCYCTPLPYVIPFRFEDLAVTRHMRFSQKIIQISGPLFFNNFLKMARLLKLAHSRPTLTRRLRGISTFKFCV